MRWYWIDRFLEFERGRRCVAVKNVTLAEEHLHAHFPGYPVMPNALVIEGVAQAGGLLVADQRGYQGNMILAKVPKAVFHFDPRPGDTLRYECTLESLRGEGAVVQATVRCGDQEQGEVEIFFANAAHGPRARQLFTDLDLVTMMHYLGAYQVGRDADGGPLRPPDHLQDRLSTLWLGTAEP